MRYYDEATAKKETEKRINLLRTYAELIPALKETARRFDNKVWNCRLLKAFQEATGQHIIINPYNDYYTIYGYEAGHYYTLATAYIKDMKDGKRINAGALCDSFNNNREKLLKEAANTEDQLNNIKEITNQLTKLKQAYEGITNNLEYTIIDNFSIPMYIR